MKQNPLINRGITNEEILERYLNRVRNEYAESKDKAQEEIKKGKSNNGKNYSKRGRFLKKK